MERTMERTGLTRGAALAAALGAALALAAPGAEPAPAADAAPAAAYVSPVTGRPFREGGRFTLEQVRARDERVLRKTGGFAVQPAEGPSALFLDARARPRRTLEEVARVYRLAARLDASVEKSPCGARGALAFALARMAEAKALFLVAVVEDGELPALSVFPEERVGLVNASRLAGGADPSAAEERVAKEAWRAAAFVCGVGYSPQENDAMQPYYTLGELDACRHPFVQPMNMARMERMCARLGVRRARRVPYRLAVREGWAAPPTNAWQRAVWDEERSGRERGPAKALRIAP